MSAAPTLTAVSGLVLRPSSLTTAADCMRRFAARHLRPALEDAGYELQRPPARHIGASVGTAVHAGAAWTLHQKRADGTLGSDTQARNAAQAALAEALKAPEGNLFDAATTTANDAGRQVDRMVALYRRQVAPGATPLLIEERLEIELPSGIVISGQPDAVLSGDPNGRLDDVKTGTRARNNMAQYGAYLSVLASHGFRVGDVVEQFIPRVPVAKPQPAIEEHRINPVIAAQYASEIVGDIERSVNDFAARLTQMRAGDPAAAFRANPASVLCGARWCPAWGTAFCRVHSTR